jgi:hypothetical protein
VPPTCAGSAERVELSSFLSSAEVTVLRGYVELDSGEALNQRGLYTFQVPTLYSTGIQL